jgi:hypothetical protein
LPAADPAAFVALAAVSPTAVVALSAALLTAATGVGFELFDCLRLRGVAGFRELAFLTESRERAWGFLEPVDRFDEALVLV